MKKDANDEFYVGYLDRAPREIAAWVRHWVVLILVFALLTAATFTIGQSPFGPAVYEFGNTRRLEGVVVEKPYPTLRVSNPGSSGGWTHYYLASVGKWGAADQVAGFDGQAVRLEGTLVYRDDQTMIEIVDGSVRASTSNTPAAPSAGQELGTMTLKGEIVDLKCYLGVMNPGSGKPHRSCASHCIRGGIPPVLVVDGGQGPAAYLLLLAADGSTVNQQVLPIVAEPVRITGEVVRYENVLVLKADPDTYRRIRE